MRHEDTLAECCQRPAAIDITPMASQDVLTCVDTSAFRPTLGITRRCGLMHEVR
jgi:hypothetical protein